MFDRVLNAPLKMVCNRQFFKQHWFFRKNGLTETKDFLNWNLIVGIRTKNISIFSTLIDSRLIIPSRSNLHLHSKVVVEQWIVNFFVQFTLPVMMKIYRKGHHINIYLGLWFVVHIFVSRIIPAGIRKIPAVLENIQWKHQSNAWDIFKVNNKETRTVSLTLFGCLFVNIE